MGMPCEVNSILKLKPSQGYPESLELSKQYQGSKEDYRIIPVDVPIPLVNEHWVAYADSGSVTHAGVGFHASTQPTFILYLIPPTYLSMNLIIFSENSSLGKNSYFCYT